jgi:FtsP/CotA-like multicopper oxidase with cupredoxin domain
MHKEALMKRRWFVGSWLLIAVAAAAALFMTLGGERETVTAETETFGPPEAEVTLEDGDWKAVHLTASVFEWQFRPDQEPVEVWGYNNQIPGPTLRFRPGDKVRIYFRNELPEHSSVHWHGLIVPNSMDGVGLLTQPGVQPGETFVYEFEIPNTPGSFMYHSHMNDLGQMGMGLVGAFIVDPRDGGDGKYDQDHIMFMNTIKGHFLINGREFPGVDPYIVKKGDVIRVRLINVGPNDSHPMHFHGHFTREIARDGTDIESDSPEARVENTVFVAPGQTVDVEVKMNAPGKGYWLFHCHIISHVMGPDGTSENIALANGGMVIPVVYADSDDFDEFIAKYTAAVEAIKPENGGTLRPADGAAMDSMPH